MGKIINKFHDTSIKIKLIVFVLIMLAYPILLVIFFGVYNNEKIIKDRFVSYVENDIRNAKNRISNDLGDMEEFFQYVLYNIDVYELFQLKPESQEAKESIAGYTFKREMEKHLKSTIFAKREFDFVTMQFDNDDDIYYAYKETGMIKIDDIPTEEFEKATEGKNEVVYYFDKDDDDIYIYLVRAVYDLETFEKIGTISIRIDNNYLRQIVGYTYREPVETTYLYTYNGERITYIGSNYDVKIIENNKVYLKEDGTYQHTVDGYDYYLIVETIDEANIKIISVVSTDMLIADTRKVLDLIILLCFISIPIYIIMANMIYSEIISPFNLLISKMKNIEKGQLDTVIDIQSRNEISYVYKTFNSMTKRLKYLVECVYEEEIARKNAEISALQAQINPHFLYNTLETINWKAQLSGEQDIAEMIQALSKLMDANMNKNGKKYITVKEEIEYMNSYLFLIQKRFGKKIEYEKIIDEKVLSYNLPKLIIQPMIENAIHHGIEPVGRGKIILHISKVDDQLIIQVEDNGAGIEPPQLDLLNKALRDKKYITEEKSSSKSIGLKNVNKRLILIYGKEAAMTIESHFSKGTKVTMSIPIKMRDQE